MVNVIGWGTGIRTPTTWARTRRSTLKLSPIVVPKVGFEPTRGHPHYALNVARLPVPPLRHGAVSQRDNIILRSARFVKWSAAASMRSAPINEPLTPFYALCDNYSLALLSINRVQVQQ